MTDTTLTEVDDEYRRRFSWWDLASADERARFVQAELDGDAETLATLTTLGERRGQFGEWTTCFYAVPAAGPAHYDSKCDCMVRTLMSDELIASLSGERFVAGTLAFVAQRLHEDAEYDIAAHIAAKEREARNRELNLLKPKFAPPPPDLSEPEPLEDPEPVIEPVPVAEHDAIGAPQDLARHSRSSKKGAAWWLGYRF
jgi:hypothetical protein